MIVGAKLQNGLQLWSEVPAGARDETCFHPKPALFMYVADDISRQGASVECLASLLSQNLQLYRYVHRITVDVLVLSDCVSDGEAPGRVPEMSSFG